MRIKRRLAAYDQKQDMKLQVDRKSVSPYFQRACSRAGDEDAKDQRSEMCAAVRGPLHIEFLITLKRQLFALLMIGLAVPLGCDNKGDNPPPPVTIKDGIRFFPLHQGNTWFYNSDQIVRWIDADTVIDGQLCVRVIEEGKTEEAWTVTSERFAQHLLGKVLWFDPPLQIPFDLQKDKPFDVYSVVRIIGEDTTATGTITGTITFRGYESKTVAETTLDSCLRFDYFSVQNYPDGTADTLPPYSEYYARGIGLVILEERSNPRYLDSAIINGAKVP